MYYYNGFVCGGRPDGQIRITDVKVLPDRIMILTFNNNEKRLFDASILSGEAYKPLQENRIFQDVLIDHGVVTWNNGNIDCAPEFMYNHSFEYESEIIA